MIKIYRDPTGQLIAADDALASAAWLARRTEAVDILDKFQNVHSWDSIDGFDTAIGGAGTIVPMGGQLRIDTGATSGNYCNIAAKDTLYYISETGKKVTLEFIIKYLSSVANQTIRLYFGLYQTNFLVYYVGWKIVNADLSAANADAVTEKFTDTGIDLVTSDQWTRLKIEFIRGTDAKFFVNGVLKATHTTYLPDIVDLRLVARITTNENAAKQLHLGRFLVEKEY